MKKLAILISGRGSNMKAIAESCQSGTLKNIAKVSIVIANKLNAKGLQTASDLSIPTAAIDSSGISREEFDRTVLSFLKATKVDYILLAGFMRRLTKEFTDAYPNKIINIHPADTNQHRGLGAYEWAWKNKLPNTKITVHYVNDKIDDGQIIAQADVDLSGTKSLQEVEVKGLAVEHQFFAQTLKTVFQKNNQK